MAKTKRVVVIEGEDAAPEAMRPSVELIQSLALPIEWIHPSSDDALRAIDAADTTFFGSTSGPSARALLYLRWGKRTYANLRPARWFPGCRSPLASPAGIDFAIVRENLEDLYLGIEGRTEELASVPLHSLTEGRPLQELEPGRFALKVITRSGTERVAHFAFELARRRKGLGHAGRLTCAVKSNMLPRSDGFFLEIVRGMASEYPDVEFESFIIDDFARRLIVSPQALDVVLLPNLYGDILSDAAAGLVGGLGLAPSGCYGDDYAYFESAHGSAPDIAGRNVINPTATLLSGVLMLEYLGFADAAGALVKAVERVYAEGKTLTPDQGGAARTPEFCRAVARAL